MRPLLLLSGLLAGAALFSGCARNPVESFSLQGFRSMKVTFIADSAAIQLKDDVARFANVAIVPNEPNPTNALRRTARKALATWGQDCGAQYVSKEGSMDPRMGLVRASDGWNVGDPAVLRNYQRVNKTDYIVVVNRVNVLRSEFERSGAGAVGRLAYADVNLDISVIDAKAGKRVLREQTSARVEESDSLQVMVPKALGLATDNFFIALPQARRWGCKEVADRFK